MYKRQVVACVERLATRWRGCVVQFFIDNAAFMQSGAKGRSRANRLNDLLRELFGLMIKFGFVIMWTWIATDDNVNADHLSRGPPVARARRRVLPDRVRDGRVDRGDGSRADAGRGPDAHLARGAGRPGAQPRGGGTRCGGGGGGGRA